MVIIIFSFEKSLSKMRGLGMKINLIKQLREEPEIIEVDRGTPVREIYSDRKSVV